MMRIATPGEFADGKRHAWLLSVLVPVLIGSGPLAALLTGQKAWLWAPIVFVYLVGPLLDTLMGEDRSNPQESEVPRLERDNYYRAIPLLLVP
ncbi:MAG TPA: alkane 1-monooxygenase, partial [Rubrivivax sp.]|nr:alkane 1-monooxygenase [Rubrivivax sp.]